MMLVAGMVVVLDTVVVMEAVMLDTMVGEVVGLSPHHSPSFIRPHRPHAKAKGMHQVRCRHRDAVKGKDMVLWEEVVELRLYPILRLPLPLHHLPPHLPRLLPPILRHTTDLSEDEERSVRVCAVC
jgi:hypothetical protein